jgi:hypothetical protein
VRWINPRLPNDTIAFPTSDADIFSDSIIVDIDPGIVWLAKDRITSRSAVDNRSN